jgi:hypothetical protein
MPGLFFLRSASRTTRRVNFDLVRHRGETAVQVLRSRRIFAEPHKWSVERLIVSSATSPPPLTPDFRPTAICGPLRAYPFRDLDPR